MKKLFALILLLPAIASAQQLRLGLGGSANTRLSIYRKFSDVSSKEISPAFSLSYLHPVFRRFEIGAEISAASWQNRLGVVISDPNNTMGGIGYVRIPAYIARPALGFGLMANYHPRFGRHSARAGLYAGGIYTVGKKESLQVQRSFPVALYFQSGSGFALGGQLGYEFALTRRIALGLECTPRYVRFGIDFPASTGIPAQRVKYSLWYFPALLNVGVRL